MCGALGHVDVGCRVNFAGPRVESSSQVFCEENSHSQVGSLSHVANCTGFFLPLGFPNLATWSLRSFVRTWPRIIAARAAEATVDGESANRNPVDLPSHPAIFAFSETPLRFPVFKAGGV